MFGRKALPVGTILIVLAILLATVGVGYGLWYKILKIEGTVHTGEVNAIFSIEEIDEGDAGLVSDNGQNEDHEIEGKEVGECTVELLDGEENPGPQLMRITMVNGYPSYSCFVNFNVQNVGSIPIKVDQPVLTHVDPGLTVDFLTGNIGTEGCYYYEENGHAVPPVIPNPQLEPKEMIFCTIWAHVEQSAAQGATLTFTASIPTHQWNEAFP
jgi:hypothetical protein